MNEACYTKILIWLLTCYMIFTYVFMRWVPLDWLTFSSAYSHWYNLFHVWEHFQNNAWFSFQVLGFLNDIGKSCLSTSYQQSELFWEILTARIGKNIFEYSLFRLGWLGIQREWIQWIYKVSLRTHFAKIIGKISLQI